MFAEIHGKDLSSLLTLQIKHASKLCTRTLPVFYLRSVLKTPKPLWFDAVFF